MNTHQWLTEISTDNKTYPFKLVNEEKYQGIIEQSNINSVVEYFIIKVVDIDYFNDAKSKNDQFRLSQIRIPIMLKDIVSWK